MTEAERTQGVRQVIATIANIEEPTSLKAEADVYKDLGIKSVNALDLLLSLEEKFEISIGDEEFGDARTVAALDKLVGSLL